MKIFAYRLTTSHDNNVGFCGIVFASTKSGLFWTLDEFCDPYACEIMELKTSSGISFAINIEEDEIHRDRLEVGSHIINALMDEDSKWRPAFSSDYNILNKGNDKL